MMRAKNQIFVIAASIFALGLALISQYGFNYYPCELCIWQRWAYGAVILFSVLSLKFTKLYPLMVLSLIVLFSIALYHFGIEQKWWVGFQTCTAAFSGGTLEDLKAQIMGAPVTRCDEAVWFFLGLSMAGWNVLYSAALIAYAIKGLFSRGGTGRSGAANS
jgi:disulfide bond formation protein DsbB